MRAEIDEIEGRVALCQGSKQRDHLKGVPSAPAWPPTWSGDSVWERCTTTTAIPSPPWSCCREKTRPRTFLCPLFTQDLFFKYTWNNFLHFQVELCIAAILSHAAREDRAEASGLEGRAELLPGSGDPEAPPPAASRPENTMVTHVSPASVLCVAVRPSCRCELSPALCGYPHCGCPLSLP